MVVVMLGVQEVSESCFLSSLPALQDPIATSKVLKSHMAASAHK